MFSLTSGSEKQTRDIGKRLAHYLRPGDIVCLFGDLGSGKTVLTKGIVRGLGDERDTVNSPSFVLMHRYDKGRMTLYHFDLYRLAGPESVPLLGYEEFLYADAVSVIEWPERLAHFLPPEYLGIELEMGKEANVRALRLSARGSRYEELIRGLRKGACLSLRAKE